MSEIVEYPTRAALIAGLVGFRADENVTLVEVVDAGRTLRITYRNGAEPADGEDDFAAKIAAMTKDEIEAGIQDGSLDVEAVFTAETSGKNRKGVLALVGEDLL